MRVLKFNLISGAPSIKPPPRQIRLYALNY